MVAHAPPTDMSNGHKTPNGNNTLSSSNFTVNSPNLVNDGTNLTAKYEYRRNQIQRMANGSVNVKPETHSVTLRTALHARRTGLMLVGVGGNNGSTVIGGILANQHKMTWRTRQGEMSANYFGSVTQASTIHIGHDASLQEQVYVPFKSILPMVEPNDLVVDGWDINNANIYEAAIRAKVFEPELLDKLRPHMESIMPRKSIYYPDFIASNQADRANHCLVGDDKQEHLDTIRSDIREFKTKNNLECVIVLWTANTERFAEVRDGLNTNAKDLLASIKRSDEEVAPSHIFAVASILEGAQFINGSPQNTLVPGIVELAKREGVFLGGDDFKSGQTKVKSALVDFLVSSGIKPESIVSYNHLGNNDGRNLSEQRQFRSKEITKSSVVDDMVESNTTLYPDGKGPDHCIVIKYVPFVGDSKRAMDEYTSSIFMNGLQTLVMHNTCEDSLLAAPLILDLAIITELAGRITYASPTTNNEFVAFDPILTILSCLLKAPMVPEGTPVTNALMTQLKTLSKLLTACAGLSSDQDMQMEFFAPRVCNANSSTKNV